MNQQGEAAVTQPPFGCPMEMNSHFSSLRSCQFRSKINSSMKKENVKRI